MNCKEQAIWCQGSLPRDFFYNSQNSIWSPDPYPKLLSNMDPRSPICSDFEAVFTAGSGQALLKVDIFFKTGQMIFA
jgi:hypothetical protein